MKDYRSIIKDEVNKGICWCCKKSYIPIMVHHIDKNRNNNIKDNLICVCVTCHAHIHKGFSKRFNSNEETIERILSLRKELIKKSYKKDVDDFLRYECAIASNVSVSKKRCYHCGSTEDIKLILPKFILKFDKENKHNLGLSICNKCNHQ